MRLLTARRTALAGPPRHGRKTSFMPRLRSPAIVALAIVLGGCAALHHRGARVTDFGAPARLPEDAAALGHFFRGEMALAQNDPDTALTEFEAAAAADPNTPLIRLRLASLYVRAGKLDRALEQVTAVVAAEPDNVEALGLLAGVQSSLGHDDEAAATY